MRIRKMPVRQCMRSPSMPARKSSKKQLTVITLRLCPKASKTSFWLKPAKIRNSVTQPISKVHQSKLHRMRVHRSSESLG